jgi:CheY-like chemotaxis protein
MLPRSILVADDNRLLRESLCDMLTDLGFRTRQVANGVNAIAVLKQSPFDLMLSDVDMPDMTGFVLLSWVRQHCPTPSVLMSARADRTLGVAAVEAGAITLLSKPVELDSVTDLVDRLFNQRG